MLAIRLMQLFSANKEDFTKLTAILGLYFQIRDDYCNLSLKEVSNNNNSLGCRIYNLCSPLYLSTRKIRALLRILPRASLGFQSFTLCEHRNRTSRFCVSLLT